MPLFLQSQMRLLRGKAAVRTEVPSLATERADTSTMIPSDAETCINWSRNRDMRKSNGRGVTLALRSRIRLTNRSTFLGVVVGAFSPFLPLTGFLLRFGLSGPVR